VAAAAPAADSKQQHWRSCAAGSAAAYPNGTLHWQPSFDVLVECLLLAPSPDMASSCLPLMTLLLQQMNAALQQHGSGSKDARDLAEVSVSLILQAAFRDVPAAVHFCMQQSSSLKQRRQLLRLWAGLLTALMHGAGAWCACSRWCILTSFKIVLLRSVSSANPSGLQQEHTCVTFDRGSHLHCVGSSC
jgi:hypothetical protein